MSETAKSGVYPCYENQFQIDTAASGSEAAMKDIADCETFEVSFDNGVEDWTPFDTAVSYTHLTLPTNSLV